MSSFQHMSRGLNNVDRQSRLLEAEMRMDASRGVTIPRKQEKLEKLEEQQNQAMNNIIETMKQMIENDKKFLDSFNETNGRIREEIEKEKNQEEEQVENFVETTWPGNASGSIVDVTIPSTVVSILPAANNANSPKEGNSQAVAGVTMPENRKKPEKIEKQQAEMMNNTEPLKQSAANDENSLDSLSEINDSIREELEKKEEQQTETFREAALDANSGGAPKDTDSQMNVPV